MCIGEMKGMLVWLWGAMGLAGTDHQYISVSHTQATVSRMQSMGSLALCTQRVL